MLLQQSPKVSLSFGSLLLSLALNLNAKGSRSLTLIAHMLTL